MAKRNIKDIRVDAATFNNKDISEFFIQRGDYLNDSNPNFDCNDASLGTYALAKTNYTNIKNLPPNTHYGNLICCLNKGFVSQLFVSNSTPCALYIRSKYFGGSQYDWTDWEKISSETSITEIKVKLDKYPEMPTDTTGVLYALSNGQWDDIAPAGYNVVVYNPASATSTLELSDDNMIQVPFDMSSIKMNEDIENTSDLIKDEETLIEKGDDNEI